MAYGYRTSFTAADKADREETIIDGRFSSSGDIALSDGSATQGAIYFADDKNTGIYSESDGQIDITTEGVKRFSITNSGVVILNRGHGSDNSSLILDKANGGYGQISFEDQGAQKSYIKVDSSENTVFQNTGTLQLYGKSQYGINIGTNGQVELRYLGSSKLETNANGIAITGTTNGQQATFGGSSSGLKISTWQKTDNDAGVTISAEHSSNGTLAFNTAGTERLRITKEGYLRYSGSSNADETNKLGRILARSHDTGEEDVMYFQMQQEDTFNQLELGGGSASFNAATKIIFRTAAVNTVTGTSRLEIDHEGVAQFGGDVKVLTGDIQMGNDRGINFSETANGPGMSSETLDDYEEGTWTPTFNDLHGDEVSDITINQANYTKIGRLVHINVKLTTAAGLTDGSHFSVSVPFTPITGRENIFTAIASGAGEAFGLKLTGDSSNAQLYELKNYNWKTYTDFANRIIWITGAYEAA